MRTGFQFLPGNWKRRRRLHLRAAQGGREALRQQDAGGKTSWSSWHFCLSPLARAWTPSWKVGEGSAKQCQTGCCWNRRKEEIFKTDGNLGSVEWLIKGLASTIKGPVSPLSLLSVTSPLLKMQKPPHPSPFPTPSSTVTMLPTYWASSDALRSAVSADITNLCDSPRGQSQPAGRRRSPSGLLLCHTSGDSSSVAPIGRHLQQPLLPCQSTACGFKSVRWGQEYFSSPIYVSFFFHTLPETGATRVSVVL